MLPTIKLVALFCAFLLLGGFIGFGLGIKTTIKAAVEIIPYFTNITIDERAINDALFSYQTHIKTQCISTLQPKA